MKRLLNIEFHKLQFNRSAKVLSIIYFFLIAFIALIASIRFNFGDFDFQLGSQGIFEFPLIWHFNTWVAGILKLFLAVVIVSMMSSEYRHRTLKQNLIDGLSKREFVLSKFLTVVCYALASTLFVIILSFLLGFAFSSDTSLAAIFSGWEYILAYFIRLTAFFSFCLFVGVLIKRSAFALGFLIAWWLIEAIIYSLLKWQFFAGTTIADWVIMFFPLESMSNLIHEPFTRMNAVQQGANIIGESLDFDYSVHIYGIVIVLFWTLILNFGSYRILKKRDL